MEEKLYQWQEDCLKQWFANNGHGMIQAVTGSGKTLLALTAAKRLEENLQQELSVKIVVPTSALMRQWNQALIAFSAEPRQSIGLRGGGQKTEKQCKYMIYVINSARYELARQMLSELREGKPVLLIADECHHYECGQNSLIFEFLPYIKPLQGRYFSLGLSATLPSGEGLSNLTLALGPKIYDYGMEEAAALRTVCQYDIFHISLSFQKEEREEYDIITDQMAKLYNKLLMACPYLGKLSQKERYSLLQKLSGEKNLKISKTAANYMALSYKRKSVVCLAKERILCAFDLIGQLDAKEKILIFGERIQQAEELYSLLAERYPGKVGRYHSKMGTLANKNALERFRMGELRILIACKAIDEGVDMPDVSIGIVLSGTSAKRQRIQRLGRIIRMKEGKNRAFLYYLHIEDSSENSSFLPNLGEKRIFELSYLPETGGFWEPSYDKAAKNLLFHLQQNGADERTLDEARRCLKLGSVRSDWKMEHTKLEEQIRKAKGTREKNYWICMKRIRLRE